MCKVSGLLEGTIVKVLVTSSILIVAGSDIYYPHVLTLINQFGEHERANTSEVEVLSTAYTGLGVATKEMLLDFTSQLFAKYEEIRVKEQEKLNKAYQQAQDRANQQTATAHTLIKVGEKYQPKFKKFLFNSHYTPKGIMILVEKKYGANDATIYFDGVALAPRQRLCMRVLLDEGIGGLTLADTTLKIGSIIGDTKILRQAFAYFEELRAQKN
jgi:hypothetical protein